MIALRVSLIAIAALLASSTSAYSQRVEIQVQPKLVRPNIELTLLPADAVEKLKLSNEQKEKYAKIETDYKDRVKAAEEKNRAGLAGVTDRAKIREAAEAMQATRAKTREDHLAKFEPILNADQKTLFAQIKVQPLPGGVRPQPIQIGGAGLNPVLPAAVQNRLQLTDEQKKQIDAIQKEVEAKIMKVLTDEQKKTLEQMKKGPQIRPNPIQPVRPIQIRTANPPADPALPNPRKN